MSLVKEAIVHNEDGTFTWLNRPLHHFPDLRAQRIWNTKYAGKPCTGRSYRNGYVYLTLWNKGVSASRLAWAYHNGELDRNLEVDHLNGNRADNRISNLRVATPNDNQHNKPIQKNNSSGFKNVRWNKQCGKWQVTMNHMKKSYHFGLFTDINEAAKAAIVARERLFKEFANHGTFQSGNTAEAEHLHIISNPG